MYSLPFSSFILTVRVQQQQGEVVLLWRTCEPGRVSGREQPPFNAMQLAVPVPAHPPASQSFSYASYHRGLGREREGL
jgi:hypothetical protein